MLQRRNLSQRILWFFAPAFCMKREIVFRTALLKTRKNIISGRESYPLKSAEKKYLYRNCPFKTIHWVDPDKIIYAIGSEKKGELIVYDGIERLSQVDQNSTSIFIRELIVQKKPLEETTLYNAMSIEFSRPVIIGGKRVRIPLNTHKNMMLYFDKCQSLIKSIQVRGVERQHQNIGLAITSDGRIAHFRYGRHRLAIAQALGIKKVPIDIGLVSGKFLVERVPRWRLWSNSAMVRAVDEVLRDTVANFSKR